MMNSNGPWCLRFKVTMAPTKTTTFPSFLVIAVFVIIPGIHAEISCPEVVPIKSGSTAIVSCNIAEDDIVNVYWFVGDTTTTSPILRLENGQPGGTEYGRGHYNITSSGAMIITNATIVHEAVYTTLVFLRDGTSESKYIKVNITISPWPSCPYIDVCIPCEECNLASNESGKLTCSINGALPMIPVKWIIKTQNGINIVEHPLIVAKDLSSGAWNSSVEISYGISSCNQQASIQCVAQDHFNLLEHFTSSIRVYSGNCADNIPGSNRAASTKIMAVIVCVVMMSTVAFGICFYRNRCRNYFTRRKDSSTVIDAVNYLETLESHLKELYKTSTEVQDLYVDCHCNVTDTKGDTSVISTEKLLKSNLVMHESRMVFTGGFRYWESIFIKPFIQQWIENDDSDFILLFISRREIKAKMKLMDVLKEETLMDGDLLAKCIRNKKCILLIHGLANITFDGEETYPDQVKSGQNINDKISVANLTFSQLFERAGESGNNQIQIWVSTWNTHPTRSNFSRPHAKINISHVDQRQFDELIDKIYKKLIKLSEKTETSNYKYKSRDKYSTNESQTENQNPKLTKQQCKISKEESESLLSDKDMKKEYNSIEIQRKLRAIKDFLAKSRFYEEFKEAPIVLSKIAYIVITKYFSQAVESANMRTPTKEDTVGTAVNSLQEAYFKKNKDTDPSKCDVNRSLGQLALHLIDTKGKSCDRQNSVLTTCGADLEVAIEMSLLKHSKNTSDSQVSDKKPGMSHCVEFSSNYFMYYFAANYSVQNNLYYTEALAKYETSQNFPVFEFMIHLATSSIAHLLSSFRKFKNDDDVIEYLHKWDNQDGVKKVMAELDGKEIKITSLDNMEHRKAFASFCEKCRDMKIKLKSIYITCWVELAFITSLELPVLSELTFCNMTVEEGPFLHILEWLSTKEMILRFLICKMPVKFSEDNQKKLHDFSNIKVKTVHQPDEIGNTISSFHYKTATWTKEPN